MAVECVGVHSAYSSTGMQRGVGTRMVVTGDVILIYLL